MESLCSIYRHFCKHGNKKPGTVKRMQVRMQTWRGATDQTSLHFFSQSSILGQDKTAYIILITRVTFNRKAIFYTNLHL